MMGSPAITILSRLGPLLSLGLPVSQYEDVSVDAKISWRPITEQDDFPKGTSDVQPLSLFQPLILADRLRAG